MSERAGDRDGGPDLLGSAGVAAIPHPSGSLLAHLEGTRDVLARWGCPAYLCAAGLHHSIYGTEVFRTAVVMLSDRDRVRAEIGAEAEELVYLYCVIARASLYENPDRMAPYHVVDRATGRAIRLRDAQQLADLLTLDLANRLEQLPRISMSLRRMEVDRRRYERVARLLPAAAVAELRAAYRPRSRPLVVIDALLRAACRRVTDAAAEHAFGFRRASRAAQRWYRRVTTGVRNPFDSPAAARRYATGRPDYHAEVVRHVAALLGEAVPVERALDVGCGTGQSTQAVARLARSVVGVDSSAFMVREARARITQPLAVARAEALPLADDSIDLIVASAAFHWFDQRVFLAEARRVARRGAWLVVYDTGFSGTIEGAADSQRWYRHTYLADFPGVPRHAAFSPGLAARAGFAVRWSTRYVNRVAMDAGALVRFLVTQSNVVDVVEAGKGSGEEIARRLHMEVEPYFRSDGRAIVRRCVFGGPLWVAAYEERGRRPNR